MKKYLQTLALLLCSLTASAYNFEVDGFCYNTISYTEVEVTYRGNSCTEYHNEYTGTVTIPATVTYNNNTYRVTSIGDEAFYGCWGLTTITIPKRVTSIGSSAFYGCSNLTTITIHENSQLTSIGEYAFLGCSNLTDITLPESVTSIGKSAFFNCSSLTSITIPENSQLTSIGNYAFKGCSSLTSINIPESVTSIEYDAFYGCSSLTAVHISSIEAWCNIDFGDSYANPLSYAKNLYIDGELVTELAIPISVTAIKDDAFSGCSSLTAITIPEGVTSIGDWAFHSCTNLTSINIPEGVTSIGSKAFSGCSSLTSINIPESVTSIGDNTFYDCSSLTSITIPESVTSIGSEAFYGCSRLTSINIPKSVTSIGDGAFSGCDLNYLVVHATNLNIEKGSSVKVAKLLVPEAALDFYQNSNWKNYCQSIESIEANLTYAFISNPSFEGGHYNCDNGTGYGDLNAPGGWQVNYTKADWGWKNFRPVFDGNKAQDGNQYFEFWADTYRTLDLSQKLHSLPPGKYVLSAAMRTEQAEQVTNQHIYAKVGDITYTSATLSAPIGSAWDAVYAWQTLSVEFTLDKAGSIVIGATSTGGAGSKGWFQIDNFQLGFSVSNISLNQTSVAIDKGETLTLTATVSPDNAINKTLTWTSSNSAVATVDSNGKVTGVGPGTAIITAKAGSRIATCVVTVEEKTIAVSNITLSQGVATLVEGEALTLIATVNPHNATNRTVTWSSDNNTVAQVDQNGRVTAMSAGVATITATADGRTATCVVTVTQKFITVSNITLSHTEVALTEGETLTLKATVSPDDATDKTVTWSSSNESVATVDNNGVVAAVSVGTATITAKAGDYEATCVVTVEAEEIVDLDMTHKVGTSKEAWHAPGNPVNIDGITMPENYQESASTLGEVLWQQVEGLENGKYTVELWANARVAWRDSPATDGQEELTYLYANNVEISMKVLLNPNLNTNATYVLEDVEVTDGTMKIGMVKKAAGSNWHTIQIKSLTLHATNAVIANIAKVDLKAALDAANAVLPKKNDFVAAIAAAQNVYDNSKDAEEVKATVASLKAATKLAILMNATEENPVLTDFVVNGTFDAGTTGWKSTTGAANQGTATNQQGAFTGAFFENWNPNNYTGKLYQVIENIPNGIYELSICAFVETFDASAQFVYANGDKVALTTGAPTAYKVRTIVDNNTIEVGFEQTVAVNRWCGIDNVSLTYLGEASNEAVVNAAKEAFTAAYEEFGTALAACQAMMLKMSFYEIDDAAYQLNAQLATTTDVDALNTMAETLAEATAALKEINEVYAGYDAFVQKFKAAAEISEPMTTEAAELLEYNMSGGAGMQAASLEALAEAAESIKSEYLTYVANAKLLDGNKFDLTYLIENPNFDKNVEGWTCVNAGHNGGAGYNNVGGLAEIALWGAESWEASITQTLNELPNGKYIVKAAWMAASGIEMTFSANEDEASVTGIGDTGGNIDNDGNVVDMGQGFRGWQYVEVDGVVVDGTLTIAVNSSSAAQFQWSNADQFQLYYAGSPESTGIENSVLEAQGSQPIYDLHGRRVEKMEKGIYIVNGKKVVIK